MDGAGFEPRPLQGVQVPLQGQCSTPSLFDWMFIFGRTLLFSLCSAAANHPFFCALLQRLSGQPPLPVYEPASEEDSNSSTEVPDGTSEIQGSEYAETEGDLESATAVEVNSGEE